jgi:hypothetical protein
MCIAVPLTRPHAPSLLSLQALLAEAGALLGGVEGGLLRQPARLQRKHASLAQFVALLSQPPHPQHQE